MRWFVVPGDGVLVPISRYSPHPEGPADGVEPARPVCFQDRCVPGGGQVVPKVRVELPVPPVPELPSHLVDPGVVVNLVVAVEVAVPAARSDKGVAPATGASHAEVPFRVDREWIHPPR